MLKKKSPSHKPDKRKKERRKPGDQRFPGRLVDKVYAAPPRKGDRRAGDRGKIENNCFTTKGTKFTKKTEK